MAASASAEVRNCKRYCKIIYIHIFIQTISINVAICKKSQMKYYTPNTTFIGFYVF